MKLKSRYLLIGLNTDKSHYFLTRKNCSASGRVFCCCCLRLSYNGGPCAVEGLCWAVQQPTLSGLSSAIQVTFAFPPSSCSRSLWSPAVVVTTPYDGKDNALSYYIGYVASHFIWRPIVVMWSNLRLYCMRYCSWSPSEGGGTMATRCVRVHQQSPLATSI